MDEEKKEEGLLSKERTVEPIVELGSTLIESGKGRVHVLTVVGQIEGHQMLPADSKSTKYEHVMPLLAMVEESDEVDGLLVLPEAVQILSVKAAAGGNG